jgi:hypothetical protein
LAWSFVACSHYTVTKKRHKEISMPPIGYSLWLWFKDNKAAQWAAGIFAGLVAFLSWQRLRDIRIRKEERQRIEVKAEKTARRVTDKAKEKTDETIRKADDARARVPDGPTADSLPDDLRDVLFGDD